MSNKENDVFLEKCGETIDGCDGLTDTEKSDLKRRLSNIEHITQVHKMLWEAVTKHL